MHILEIPSFFPPHGGLFCLEQAKALKSRGHEVRILSCVSLAMTVDGRDYFKLRYGYWKETMDGIEVFRHFQRNIPKMVYVNTALWLKNVYNMFEVYIEEHGKPDIIHAHCCKFAGIAAYRISQKYDIPYFVSEHISSGLIEKDFGKGWTRHKWLKQLLTEAYENASCVIPVSDELIDDIAPFFGKNYKREVVSNIIDTKFFTFRKRETLKNRPFRFCCLAIANIYEKGYDILHEAWKNIPNAELHIAGRGTDGAGIKCLFSDYNNVRLYGHLDKEHVMKLLCQCDALVLPSRSEAQPLVVLEALATGMPVVGTECIPRSERKQGACIIVPIGDYRSLHAAMEEVKTVPLSISNSEFVRNLASPGIVAEKLETVFNKYKYTSHCQQ